MNLNLVLTAMKKSKSWNFKRKQRVLSTKYPIRLIKMKMKKIKKLKDKDCNPYSMLKYKKSSPIKFKESFIRKNKVN